MTRHQSKSRRGASHPRTLTQRIDRAIARYVALKADLAGLNRARGDLVRLARRHGVRRAGRLVLLGRWNLAELVREPATVISRFLRPAHWKVTRTEVRNQSRVTSHQSRSSK